VSDAVLRSLRDLIQEDIGGRGLATHPEENLLTTCPDDFAAACRSLADAACPAVGIITGFFIPHAQPPAAETDGPLGALFLARTLAALDGRIVLAADASCTAALHAGLDACGLAGCVPVVTLPAAAEARALGPAQYRKFFEQQGGSLSHLIAIERVGPNDDDRCLTMRGMDVTEQTSPAHWLFEPSAGTAGGPLTIGIGDGGNEIGMGKISRHIIARNIARGAAIACRVRTDFLIVCGISNWGAYGLAAGVCRLRGRVPPDLFDPDREQRLLRIMVEKGPLVDGVSGRPAATVDGIPWDRYVQKLVQIRQVMDRG
jgi:D-glutamate cyclase